MGVKSLFLFINVITLCGYIYETNGQLPSYMTACNRHDPKLNDCVLKVAKASAKMFSKGDPSRGFIRLDPLKIKEIKTAAFGNKDTGINIHFKDVTIKGMKKMDMHKFKIDLKTHTWQVQAGANLTLEANYNLKGRLLIFPLVGNGRAHLDMKNMVLKYSINQGFTTKNGVTYATVKGSDMKYEIEGLKIKLDNLFNGDKILGETTNRLLNENWRDVVTDIGPAISNAVKKELTKLVEVFCSQISYDELLKP